MSDFPFFFFDTVKLNYIIWNNQSIYMIVKRIYFQNSYGD